MSLWRADVYKGSKPWSKDIPDERGEWSISRSHPAYPDNPHYRECVAVLGFGVEAMRSAQRIVELHNAGIPQESEKP